MNHILGSGLSIAIDDGKLRGFHLLDQIRYDKIFTAALRTYQNETLITVKQRLYYSNVFLDAWCHYQRRLLRVLNILYGKIGLLLDEVAPALEFRIVIVHQRVWVGSPLIRGCHDEGG